MQLIGGGSFAVKESMTKKTRVLVFFLVVLLIFLFVLFMLVDAVYVPEKEPIIYPQGELVDSVFVAQNNKYVENESLSNTYSFETVPYLVDVPDGNGAKVGTGTVYQISNSFFAYVSEYTDQFDVQDVITAQFPVALLINYIPEATRVTVNGERTGYINGFKAKYIADSLSVTDGASNAEAIVLGYALDLPEGNYYGNHMFIAVCTTQMSTDAADKCSQVLSALIKTVRYDEKLDADIGKERETAKEEQEKAVAEAQQMEESEVEVDTGSGDTVTTTVVGDETTVTIPIEVPVDYTRFTLQVDWTLNNPNAILELFTPDGLQYISPVTQDPYYATFALDSVAAGTYQLRIKNYQQCGDIRPVVSGTPVE